MNRSEVIKMIEESNGKFLRVTFKKRTTGEIRVMVCKVGVTSALKGGEPTYDAKDHELIRVFDVQKKEYRSIPYEGIIEIKLAGILNTVD